MSDVIFALPRTEYGSYVDLYRLIELSEYSTCFIDEIDAQSDNAYIITIRNGEIPAEGWRDPRAHIILQDLEWRREREAPVPGVAEVWMCDRWQAELIGAKYVPIGGHAGLRPRETTNPEHYDVAFLAYMTHRRQHIRNDLLARGVALTPTSAWGMERDLYLSASRAYLHVHQSEEFPAVPGLRLVVAAAYKMPVLMESCADYGVFAPYLYRANYNSIGALPFDALMQEDAIQGLSERLHDFLCCDLTFRKSVEAAL